MIGTVKTPLSIPETVPMMNNIPTTMAVFLYVFIFSLLILKDMDKFYYLSPVPPEGPTFWIRPLPGVPNGQ
jgi:hypothetical protein